MSRTNDTYRVMAIQETGEESCMISGVTEDEAENWLHENADAFIEWSFHIEKEENHNEHNEEELYNEGW